MENALLIVETDAVEGREDEFHRWYDTVHIPHMLELDGFVSARRYAVSSAALPGESGPGRRFLAVYEVEPGRVEDAARALRDAWSRLAADVPDALDRTSGATHVFYEPLPPVA